EIKKVARRLLEHDLELELVDEVKQFLLEKGTDEKFGARPLRRAIEQLMEDPLSEEILRGGFKGKHKVRVTLGEVEGEKKLVFTPIDDTPPAEPALAGAAEAT